MVHPHWVRGLFGYWEWLNRQIEQSGGYLTSGSVIEPQAIAGDSDDPDEWPIMRIPDHTLVFGNTFLTFDITITNDLEQVRVAGWCPKCLVSSLGALVFGIVVGGVPTGMVRSVPFCVDCGRLTQ